jgi:hypothetical protein
VADNSPPSVRRGENSKRVTPVMMQLAWGLRRTRSSGKIAEEMGVLREYVAKEIRLLERKLGARLFERHRGGSPSATWEPIDSWAWQWMRDNRMGGIAPDRTPPEPGESAE